MSRKVYVEFTKPKNHKFPILSWMIRKLQKTPYSHVRLRWQSTSGISIIYEASGSHVKVIGSKAASENPVEVLKTYEVDVSREEYRALIRLFDYASVSYGRKQILGIGLAMLFNLKKNPLSEGESSQVCSELVALFFLLVKGWDLKLNLDLAGPKEIDLALQKLIEDGTIGLKLVA